jgi:hypothetical protein
MFDRIHLYDGSVANPLELTHPESPVGGGTPTPSSDDWVLLLKK